MSGLARWKENRIRQGIYLGHLKHTNTSSSRGGFNGVGNGAITLKYGGQVHFIPRSDCRVVSIQLCGVRSSCFLPEKLDGD
jgi:hypothetical protein